MFCLHMSSPKQNLQITKIMGLSIETAKKLKIYRTFMLYPESGQLSISRHVTTGNYNFFDTNCGTVPPHHMTEQCGAGTVVSH